MPDPRPTCPWCGKPEAPKGLSCGSFDEVEHLCLRGLGYLGCPGSLDHDRVRLLAEALRDVLALADVAETYDHEYPELIRARALVKEVLG